MKKTFSCVLDEHGIEGQEYGMVRSSGDKGLFNKTTKEAKKFYGVKDKQPLADGLPTILLTAKMLSEEMTIYNIEQKELMGVTSISNEHYESGKAVRNTLEQQGIKVDQIAPAENIKRVEQRAKQRKLLE